MGLRFRKSVKLAPGIKLNFGKKGVGMSFGGKGARFSVNSSGRSTATLGVPGTGLSYSTSLGGKKKRTTKRTAAKQTATKATVHNIPQEKKPTSDLSKVLYGIFGIVLCLVMVVHGIINITQSGWILAILGLIVGFILLKFVRNLISAMHRQPNDEQNKKAGE